MERSSFFAHVAFKKFDEVEHRIFGLETKRKFKEFFFRFGQGIDIDMQSASLQLGWSFVRLHTTFALI